MSLIQDLKTAWETKDVEHLDSILSERRPTKLVKAAVDGLDSDLAIELCIALCRRVRIEGCSGVSDYYHEGDEGGKGKRMRGGVSEDLKMFSLWLRSILMRFRDIILTKLLENMDESGDGNGKDSSGNLNSKELAASLRDELRLLSIDVHNRAAVETSLNKLEGRLDLLIYQLALDKEIHLVSSEKVLSIAEGKDEGEEDSNSEIESSDTADEEELSDESVDDDEEQGFTSHSE